MGASVREQTLDEAEEGWEHLLPLTRTSSVFVTPWWQRVWWKHFGAAADLWVLSVVNESKHLGIAPLMRKDGVVGFLGDTDVCDFTDFVVSEGSEPEFYDALCRYLAAAPWETLHLQSLPAGSAALRYVPEMARERGYDLDIQEEDMSPVAVLPSTWEGYLAGLSKKDRHELRRKLRRLEGAGEARQYDCTDPESLRPCMEDFFRLLRASRADKLEYMTPVRERFFVDVALELARRDQLRLSFLEVDGVRAAACINFDYMDSYLLYNSGYDPAYSTLSVGLLNKALTIRAAIEGGKKYFNFLRGTERYKYHLGGIDQPVYRLIVRR